MATTQQETAMIGVQILFDHNKAIQNELASAGADKAVEVVMKYYKQMRGAR